jgi:hypothetical protein
MKKILMLLVALLMLSLSACSNAPKEYLITEPQEESLFVEETKALEEQVIKEAEEVVKEETHIEEAEYIGNSNSYKFHEPDCSSVDAMNESNKVFLKSRQEAIDKGFEPCKRCNP